MSQEASLFATCAPGLDTLLLAEANELGLAGAQPEEGGGVRFDYDLDALYRANLSLRIAVRVQVRLPVFGARRFDELTKKAGRLPWSRFIGAGKPIYLRARCHKTRLIHSGAVEERVHHAIRGSVKGAVRRASAEDASSATRIDVHLEDNRCRVAIDTSGEPLHRRGYRLAVGKAPLREDLAAALLRFSGWDRASSLVDPMMGSGVIPIEAALWARGVPPGIGRDFTFASFPAFDSKAWERVREEAIAGARSDLDFVIGGSDRDAGAVASAEANAERAGVRANVQFAAASLSGAPLLDRPPAAGLGAVVTNPPYGRRLSKGQDLRPLYQRLGAMIEQGDDHPVLGLVSSDRKLAYATGIRLHEAQASQHGGRRVYLFRRA